jgi:hypothetical protein
MRRALLLAACVLVAAACGGGATASSAGSGAGAATSLQVTEQPKGTDGPTLHATLRCGPPGGTHPHAAAACAALARLAHPFAPKPAGVMCSTLYSGPQRAHVTGTYRGVRIDARFTRTDSCETGRWTLIQPVLQLS